MVRKSGTGIELPAEGPGVRQPADAAAPAALPPVAPGAALQGRPPPLSPASHDLEQLLTGPALLLVDGRLRLRHFTSAAGALFHLQPGQLGRSIADIDLGLATREIEVLLRDAIGRGTSMDHEVQDRLGHWFLLCAHPQRSDTDAMTGATLLVVSVDRFKRSEQALRDSDRRKDEFIATLAHELRSPLAALRDANEVVSDPGARVGDLAQARAVMSRQIANMVRMVDDLAELSRMQHGHLRLRPETVDIVGAVRSAAAATEHERRALGQTLALDLPAGSVEIVADAVRLEQIFANLLGNASKATPRRGEIALSLEPADDIDTEIKVRVRQSDAPFSAQPLPRVLDVFSAAPAPPTSRAAMSLGLYLARTLAELHGGSLEVHGGGSELVLRLPLVGGGGKQQVAAPAARRVLVVDDNIDAARIMAMVLSVAGHEVRLVHLGRDTLAAARTFRPDAVLLDIGLPDIDGYQVARQLRADPDLAGLLLVAVTGHGREQDVRASRAAGFDEHFTKPVSPEALNALITRLPARAPPAPGEPA